MCFDSDSDDGVLNKIGAVLQTLTLQSVREAQRPGRDGHLWLFFGRPVDGGVLIEFGRLVLQWAGLGSNECEVYPKTTKNSQVRAPLGIHRKPGANPMRGCFADAAQGIDAQLVFIAQQPYSRSVVVEELVRKARELTPKEVNRERAFSVDIKTSLELVDIRDYVQARRNGSKEYGQGPACAAENHDRSENNLVVALRRRNGLLLRLRRRRARARERRNSESAWTLAGKGGVVQTAHFAFQKKLAGLQTAHLSHLSSSVCVSCGYYGIARPSEGPPKKERLC